MKQASKKLLSALLALALTLGLLPAAALAEGDTSAEPETVVITMTAQAEGAFLLPRQTLTVPANLSDTYGYTDNGTEPTVVDAMIAAHIQRYGDAFTPESASDYFTISGAAMTKAFEKPATASGFLVDHNFPNDGNGNGYGANEAILTDGAQVDFFLYQDKSSYGDWYTYFEPDSFDAVMGEPFTLQMKGFALMDLMFAPPAEAPDGTPIEAEEDAMSFSLVDPATGEVGEAMDGVTLGLDGKVALTFDAPGTYIVTASGFCSDENDDYPIVSPCCEVTVAPSTLYRMEQAMAGLAEAYAGKDADWWGSAGDWWYASALGAYQSYTPETAPALSEDAEQAFLNKIIGAAATASSAPSSSASALATGTIGLRALGYDPQKAVTVNKTVLDLPGLLKTVDVEEAAKGWYATVAPYTVLALQQGTYDADAARRSHLDYLLTQLDGNKAYLDSYAMVLQGIACFYGQDEAATAAVDGGIAALSEQQENDGTFGNASTNAMVILLLAQLGIDPDIDPRFIKNGNSLVDALLSQLHEKNGGPTFGEVYYDSQGLLALTAAAQVMKTGEACTALDFSAKPLREAAATGSGSTPPPEPDDKNEDITVSLTLKSDTATWIPKTTLTVKDGSTVYHAFVKALNGKKYTYEGAASGYVTAITTPEGDTLSEFDKGPNSGWLYTVNGELPNVGLTSYKLSAGDDILWYYTTDWTADPDAGHYTGGSGSGASTPSAALKPQASMDKDGTARAEVSARQVASAVEAAKKSGGDVVIAPEIKGSASAVSVSLPHAAAQAIAQAGNVSLRVETGIAGVSLSPAALAALTHKDGKEVAVSIQTSEDGLVSISILMDGKDAGKFTGLSATLPVAESTPGMVLVLVDTDGKETVIKKSAPVEDGVTALLDGSATVAVREMEAGFSDVTGDHWAGESVAFAAARGLFQGTSSATFSPETETSRAMAVTALWRLEDEAEGSAAYPDVAGDAWYAGAAAWAGGQGIVSGTGAGFSPEAPVTRESLAVLLYRYADALGLDTKAGVDAVNGFHDADAVSPWAAEAMAWAVSNGILDGENGDALNPSGTATRAETAAVLERFVKLIVK